MLLCQPTVMDADHGGRQTQVFGSMESKLKTSWPVENGDCTYSTAFGAPSGWPYL